MSFQYQLWDHKVISDLDLGELESASEGSPLCGTVRLNLASEKDWAEPSGVAVLEHFMDNGDLWFASWNTGNGYVARFTGLCSFRMLPDEMRIDCAPEPGIAESTIVHLILDQALPRLLSLKADHLVLHASAVQAGSQVMAIMGESGQGKSTLAAWLASQGFPLLTDDCLVLRKDETAQQWLAQPSYQSVRLWPDSVDALKIDDSALREFAHYSSKKRTGKQVDFRFAAEGAPVQACFVLAEPTDSEPLYSGPPVIRPLSVSESFLTLVQAVFRLDAEKAQLNRKEFEVLTSLTETVRFFSLSYKRQYDCLPEVQKAMIETVEALPPRG